MLQAFTEAATMATVVAIIPCSSAKRTTAARASEFYVGTMFKNTLSAAESMDCDVVLILSAKHGLITLDTFVEPYDVRMGDEGSVTAETIAAQAQALGLTWEADVFALLPAAYLETLDAALRILDIYVNPVYAETARGIGDQRHINGVIANTQAATNA